jgi:hypothetical protein
MKKFFTNLYWSIFTWSQQSNFTALLAGALMIILFAAIGLTPWIISLFIPSFWYGFIISIVIFALGIASFIGMAIYNSLK